MTDANVVANIDEGVHAEGRIVCFLCRIPEDLGEPEEVRKNQLRGRGVPAVAGEGGFQAGKRV